MISSPARFTYFLTYPSMVPEEHRRFPQAGRKRERARLWKHRTDLLRQQAFSPGKEFQPAVFFLPCLPRSRKLPTGHRSQTVSTGGTPIPMIVRIQATSGETDSQIDQESRMAKLVVRPTDLPLARFPRSKWRFVFERDSLVSGLCLRIIEIVQLKVFVLFLIKQY